MPARRRVRRSTIARCRAIQICARPATRKSGSPNRLPMRSNCASPARFRQARDPRRVAMPRLFTALELPSDVAAALALTRGGLFGARWIGPENYHITLRFIGDIDARLADEVADALDDVSRMRAP